MARVVGVQGISEGGIGVSVRSVSVSRPVRHSLIAGSQFPERPTEHGSSQVRSSQVRSSQVRSTQSVLPNSEHRSSQNVHRTPIHYTPIH